LKNGLIIAVLFLLLNIDVAALLYYANFSKATPSQQHDEKVAFALDVPVEVFEEAEKKVIIDVDIVVEDTEPPEPAIEPTLEKEEEPVTQLAALAEDKIAEIDVPAIRRDVMLSDISNFRQDERGWAYDPLGQTQQTMREFGCTVTSVANAITNYDRDYITPKILNKNLVQVGGFTDRGWLVWSQIERATDGKYSARVFGGGDPESNIDSCLAANEYPVVKIMLRGEVQHWVLVVGRKNGEYMVRDPLEGDRADHPIPLSSRANRVHSVRCIRRNF